MYLEPIFKVNVKNNTVDTTFAFSHDLRDFKLSGSVLFCYGNALPRRKWVTVPQQGFF